MDKSLRFPCGCEFEILGEPPTPGGLPLLHFDAYNIRPDCKATWDILARGHTKGVFQLESPLGKQWSKTLRPREMEHMSALGALLRPGPLKAEMEPGLSMTRLYCLRVNGEAPVTSFHPALDPILSPTYQVLVYQEQSMLIGRDIAGFDLKEVDKLRKCVTKETRFVSRKRGWVSIDTLLKTGYENDEFLVMDGSGKQAWKKIKRIWSTGQQKVYSVRSASGFEVRATKYHQFLTDTGWKARMRLQPEADHLIAAREVAYDGEDTIPFDEAMLIAGIVTEGHFVSYRRATFVNHDEFMMQVFCESFRKVFNEEPTLQADGRVVYLKSHQKERIANYLGFGLSATKKLPDAMMGATYETTRAFVSYMLGAEGGATESNGQFEFSSKSIEMAKQVKLLLLRFGIRSLLLRKTVRNRDETYWRLYINDVCDQRKLLKLLSDYWPSYKRESLRRVIDSKSAENYTADVVPTTVINKLLNQYPWVARDESGTAFTSSLSRNRFSRLALRSQDLSWIELASGRHQYDLLKAIDMPRTQIETFDFTVEGCDTPYIIAEGLVIHNSIGKKDEKELSAVGELFLTKAKEKGIVPYDVAEMVWSWIKRCGRYQFNKSHSLSYGVIGYITAFIKAHFPVQGFAMWLRYAQEKSEPLVEVAELVSEAKLFDVPILPPDFRTAKKHFSTDFVSVRFGLSDVKGVGPSQIAKLREGIAKVKAELGKPVGEWSWLELLSSFSHNISASVMERLISVGAFDYFGAGLRTRMLEEFKLFASLTDKEKAWVRERKFSSFLEAMRSLSRPIKPQKLGGCHNEKRRQTVLSRIQLLEKPPTPLEDLPNWVARTEAELLGVALTCSEVDGLDQRDVNTSCKEFINGSNGHFGCVILGVKVESVRTVKVKKGKSTGRDMAFLTVSDSSCALADVIVFSDEWEIFKDVLVENNCVIIRGERGRKNDGFIVKKACLM